MDHLSCDEIVLPRIFHHHSPRYCAIEQVILVVVVHYDPISILRPIEGPSELQSVMEFPVGVCALFVPLSSHFMDESRTVSLEDSPLPHLS